MPFDLHYLYFSTYRSSLGSIQAISTGVTLEGKNKKLGNPKHCNMKCVIISHSVTKWEYNCSLKEYLQNLSNQLRGKCMDNNLTASKDMQM